VSRLLTISLLVLLSGCQWWQDVEVVRIEGLSDIAMSLNGMQGEVQVLVKNPNGFDIRAQEVDVNMYVGEDRIATVTLPGVQVLEARSESVLVMNVQSDPGALKKLLQNQLLQLIGGNSVEFRTVGTVRGKAFGLNIAIPIESIEEINL
tara:strand:- start:14 stop:460 length:447 start_codon:yes stop_codon:yes gene_type:complete